MLVASDEATRLGHAEGRTDFAAQQRFQPLALLRLAAVAHQHFHVAGIRRRAVERFRARPELPMISASGAYSVLVRPAPSSDSGRNRFHTRLGLGLELLDGCQRSPSATCW